jgi:hypothetical protein
VIARRAFRPFASAKSVHLLSAAWSSCDLNRLYLPSYATTICLSMERKKTISASALLSKQLENITKTLAKASQRRDAELQRRRSKPTITSRDPSNCVLPTDVQARSSDKQSHYYQEQIERPKKDIPSVGVESLLASICATSPTERE